jgi:hypothetical protein
MSKAIVRGQGGVHIASIASLIAHQSMHPDYPSDVDIRSRVPLYAPQPGTDNEDVAVSDLSSQDEEDPSDL